MNNDKVQDIRIGFSTGAFYESCTTKQALKLINELGCNIVELSFLSLESIIRGWLDEIGSNDLEKFQYVSLHAPEFDYEENEISSMILNKIKEFNDRTRKLDLVIFHPHTIRDFSIIQSLGIPTAIENMNNRKQSCRFPDDIEEILKRYPDFTLVLDVNHVYSNDQSMEICSDFYRRFGNKISEIHLSGYNGRHHPLFKTKQVEIIKRIKDFSVPIIIESVINPSDIKKERDFILDHIRNARCETFATRGVI